MNTNLKVIHFRGVVPVSLGGYLMGLGLISACSKPWPDIRGCWREGHFALLHPNHEFDLARVQDFLLSIWVPPKYPSTGSGKPFWLDTQKTDTKKKTSMGVQHIRSTCSLKEIGFLDSHLVSVSRNVFNPIFGSGGNIGKRNLVKVAIDAQALLTKADQNEKSRWLDHTLTGTGIALPELQSTGTWFVFANKTYNSGQDGFYREGRLSPWSFLLALEGALLLAGGIGRRLSAKARPYAVFPFVAKSADPSSENEVGLKRSGEFWAPLWEFPSTIFELRALLRRGLARIGQCAATAPHEFGAAALGEGVDTGIHAFVPYELRETTSGQTYEAIPRGIVKVYRDVRAHHAAKLIAALVPWIERLPFEPTDSKQRGKYAGLRGPIEQAIREVTEEPDDPIRWQSLILKLADTQIRIDQDRTRDWRKRCRALPRLSWKWLDYLWPDGRLKEVEVACAIASIGAMSISPLLVNIFGVDVDRGYPHFPKNRPLRTVWYEGAITPLFIEIVRRRLVDTKPDDTWPLDATYPIPVELVNDFLNGALDDNEIGRWLPALSLLDWRQAPVNMVTTPSHEPADGMQLLDGFFRPLLASGIRWGEEEAGEPVASFVLRLISLLQQDDIETAIDLACSRIRALGRVPAALPVPSESCGSRLAAALLIPVQRSSVYAGRERWLLPIPKENER